MRWRRMLYRCLVPSKGPLKPIKPEFQHFLGCKHAPLKSLHAMSSSEAGSRYIVWELVDIGEMSSHATHQEMLIHTSLSLLSHSGLILA